MVGSYALRYALDHLAVGRVTAIGRRTVGIPHPKLKEVLHRDFADCSVLADALSDHDAAIFCLGAYTGVVSDAELRKVTVDYPAEFTRVLRAASPAACFLISERQWRGPDGSQPHRFRTLQG
jgi:putative NADH-flavin reductase